MVVLRETQLNNKGETKMEKRTKQQLIDTIVIVVGSISKVINEDLLATYSIDKLIAILVDYTGKSYKEINYIKQ